MRASDEAQLVVEPSADRGAVAPIASAASNKMLARDANSSDADRASSVGAKVLVITRRSSALAEAEICIHARDAIEMRTSFLLFRIMAPISESQMSRRRRGSVSSWQARHLPRAGCSAGRPIDALPAARPRAPGSERSAPRLTSRSGGWKRILRLILSSGGNVVAAAALTAAKLEACLSLEKKSRWEEQVEPRQVQSVVHPSTCGSRC